MCFNAKYDTQKVILCSAVVSIPSGTLGDQGQISRQGDKAGFPLFHNDKFPGIFSYVLLVGSLNSTAGFEIYRILVNLSSDDKSQIAKNEGMKSSQPTTV